MDIDIGFAQIAALIAESTTDYLVMISPVLLLIGGIILAFGIIAMLVNVFFKKNIDIFDGGGGNDRI
jgi:predicted membrane channel-forming protein YqfA (hemolysin III family)